MITVNGTTLSVSTKTLDAVLEAGTLVSLKSKTGREYLSGASAASPTLEIVFRGGDKRPVKTCPQGRISCVALSDSCAEIRFDALDGNGVLTITEDEENGDLCIEPEVSSARYGVLAARWTVSGFSPDMKITAPFFQGIDMDPEDELIRGRKWIWPHRWEAGLCIFHDAAGGSTCSTADGRSPPRNTGTGCGRPIIFAERRRAARHGRRTFASRFPGLPRIGTS